MTGDSPAPCIVGIGETEYTRWGGITDRSELGLACQAIKAACDDAGLDVRTLDGVVSFADDSSQPWFLQEALGLPALRFPAMVWGGGGSGAYAALALADAAIRSGQAERVVVFRSLCQGQHQRFGQGYPLPHSQNFHHPFGMLSPVHALAPLAQRYKAEFGVPDEHFGAVSVAFRRHAARNPRAVFHDRPLTMEQYLAARMIAEPLRLYDCCQENDGACAMVVTTRERARDLRQKPVELLAAGWGNDPGWGSGGLGSHAMPAADYGRGNGRALAARLYGQAGLSAKDIDTAQFYDHFTPFVLQLLELHGFCGTGEGGAYAASGAICWPDGALPLNTSGGHLSEAYIHGLNLALEGVRQLRGTSTAQVANASTCLVSCGVSGAIFGA